MNRLELKKVKRLRRKAHIRKRVTGTPERPRMTVYRSARYIYIQVIDDSKGHTLACASNRESSLSQIKSTVAGAGELGQVIGKRLKEKSVAKVVFDRNAYAYHGVVKAIAEGARKAGIEF
jgi:large subunit ribosomal protein L18